MSTSDSTLLSNIFQNLKPNIIYDKKRTDEILSYNLSQINNSKGTVKSGVRIISRGEIVDSEKLSILNSLKSKFENESSSELGSRLISIGYYVIISIIILFLFMFLKKNRKSIFLNNTKMMFIFTIVLIFITLVSLVVKFQPNYIYVVPLCSIPLLLRAFFDSRLGLFTYVMTILTLSFFVSDGFEFIGGPKGFHNYIFIVVLVLLLYFYLIFFPQYLFFQIY